MATEWVFREGDITTRAAVKELYGGSTFRGIEASRSSPNIMIYTDASQGERYGYTYDGPDEEDSNVFYYTGEGPNGDQELTKGNRAIYEHYEDRRTLRLFKVVGGKRSGGKQQEYLGAFRLDAEQPYRMEPAPGRDGQRRQVIVFRMIREGAAAGASAPAPPMPHGKPPAPSASPMARRTPGAGVVADSTFASSSIRAKPSFSLELVSSEQNEELEYETTTPSTGDVARRAEAMLVMSFEEQLRSEGHDLKRARITVPGQAHALVTDTYDATAKRLYEAKSTTDRPTIRLGIGQLIDYLRFLPGVTGALLLPEEPVDDLKSLVRDAGFGLVYLNLGIWTYVMSETEC